MGKRIATAMLIAFLAGCVSSAPEHGGDEAIRLLVTVVGKNSLGAGVRVSQNVVVTSRHVVKDKGILACMGSTAQVDSRLGKDKDIAVLFLTEDRLDEPNLPMGRWKPGLAEVVTINQGGRAVVQEVVLRKTKVSCGVRFDGWTPHKGQSGSPISQRGRLVGVVTKIDFPNGGYMEPVTSLFPNLKER